MLEQLIALVKQNAGQTVIENPAIPNEHNEQVMAEASNTVVSGLQNLLSGGGLQSILQLFSDAGNKSQGNSTSGLLQNPIVSMMVGHFTKKLMGNYSLSSGQANQVASNLIPDVLNGLITKTKDPADNSIDLNSIISSLTGGKVQTGNSGGGFDFQSLLNQFTNSSQASNSGFNIQEIISQVTEGAQQNQEQQVRQSGGGLMDMLKGFFN